MMKGFSIVPADTNISFVPRRLIFFVFSAALMVASVGLVLTKGLNFGIDFEGGIVIEVETDGPADISEMRSTLGGLGLGEVSLQRFGDEDTVLIRVQRQQGGEGAEQAAIDRIKEALPEGVNYRRTEFVGPTVSEELLERGIEAVALAIGAILIYIWFRFEWQFGLGAVVALTHDVISTVGVFALIQHEFNLATVAAVLTIAGYSINDTVVVYDRVREMLRKYKKMPLPEVLNMAINQTLSRTVMTSLTTLIALGALYFLGGPVIQDFAFAMIWGIVIGTYSSIGIAVPLLIYMKLDRSSRGGVADDAGKDDAAEESAGSR